MLQPKKYALQRCEEQEASAEEATPKFRKQGKPR